jgi:hypothetical protein
MNTPSRHQRKLQKNMSYRGACVYDPRRKFPRMTQQEREQVKNELCQFVQDQIKATTAAAQTEKATT